MTTTTETPAMWATPSARLLLPVTAGRTEWLKARTGCITGTDIAALTGAANYADANPFRVWQDKTGNAPDSMGSEAMWWGAHTEALTAQRFTEITGVETRRTGMLAHRDHPTHAVNIDRLTADGGVLEIKDHETLSHAGRLVSKGEIPANAMAQIQWALHVTGRGHGWFAAKVGKRAIVLGPVNRDGQLITRMTATADRFWSEHVLTGVPPNVDPATVTDAELAQRFPFTVEGVTVESPSPAADLMRREELERITAELKALTERKAGIERHFKAEVGDGEYLLAAGRPIVSYKSVETTRCDTAALKRDEPQVWERFKKTTTSRRFTLIGDKS